MRDWYIDPILAGAKGVLGEPRFHPPGSHPATARLRAERDKLLSLPESSERDQALDYVQDKLAMFEELESLGKATYLVRAGSGEGTG